MKANLPQAPESSNKATVYSIKPYEDDIRFHLVINDGTELNSVFAYYPPEFLENNDIAVGDVVDIVIIETDRIRVKLCEIVIKDHLAETLTVNQPVSSEHPQGLINTTLPTSVETRNENQTDYKKPPVILPVASGTIDWTVSDPHQPSHPAVDMKPFLIYPLSDLPVSKQERAARLYWHLDMKIALTYQVSESLCRLRDRAFVISDLILHPSFHSPDCYDEWLAERTGG